MDNRISGNIQVVGVEGDYCTTGIHCQSADYNILAINLVVYSDS